jgi:3',5'-cyclic AMP phosphodiesterase CpdA
MPVTLLHLSDLHLGEDIITRALWKRRAWWGIANQGITAGLKKSIRDLQPDYIIVSGDFVNKAEEQTFRVAAKYLRELFLDSGFDLKERVLVVPGNHDVSFFPSKHTDDSARLYRYKEFLKLLFNESDLESRKARFLLVDQHRQLIFLCLDSTLKTLIPAAEGQIGLSQRGWIERKMKQAERHAGASFKRYAKIAVVHHHPEPIVGSGADGERLMQLLDAGDLKTLLLKHSFNIVLHGHKHIPHIKPLYGSDSSVLTVIGAGTTTCRFLEEQHTFGNNFNLIKIDADLNQLTQQLYRANPEGEFVPTGNEFRGPLFRIQPAGFGARRMKKTVNIESNGTYRVTVSKERIRVERPGVVVRTLPLRIYTEAKGSKITDLWIDSKYGKMERLIDSETCIDGDFVLKEPLAYGDPDISQFYSYTVLNGNAMVKADLAAMYVTEREHERASVIVRNPMEMLEIELNFPRGYPSVPRVTVSAHGSIIPASDLAHTFEQVDILLNRWYLRVENPPLNHVVGLSWPIPDSWNPVAGHGGLTILGLGSYDRGSL